MAVHIPIFLSKPTSLNAQQEIVLRYVREALKQENLTPRTLGQSDFPASNPIAEVASLARACYGGLILGFIQIETPPGIYRNAKPPKTLKKGETYDNTTGTKNLGFASPWNQLEAGMLVAYRKPLLVFAEKGVRGGIFDQGAFSGYLQTFEAGPLGKLEREVIRERVRVWSAEVRLAFRSLSP